MTRPRREVPAGSAAPENSRNVSPKTNRPPRNRRSRADTRQNNPQAEPALTQVQRTATGHPGRNQLLPSRGCAERRNAPLPLSSRETSRQQALHRCNGSSTTSAKSLARLEQGKLSNSERRSALVLRPYMDSLSALIGAGYFGDTLWQLRNARRGLYQLLYMTEIPACTSAERLSSRRLEELSTPPTAPAEHIQLRSGSHQELALEESHIIDQYLLLRGRQSQPLR